ARGAKCAPSGFAQGSTRPLRASASPHRPPGPAAPVPPTGSASNDPPAAITSPTRRRRAAADHPVRAERLGDVVVTTGSEPRGPILDGGPRSATAPARSPARAHRATSHHRAGVADGRDGPGERELLGQVLAEHLGATEQRSLLVVDRAHDADRRGPAARRRRRAPARRSPPPGPASRPWNRTEVPATSRSPEDIPGTPSRGKSGSDGGTRRSGRFRQRWALRGFGWHTGQV